MLIYEYFCSLCNEYTAYLQFGYDKELKECPKCRDTLNRVLSSTNYVLKGDGFYSTSKGESDD